MKNNYLKRRTFLTTSALAGAGLSIGFNFMPEAAFAAGTVTLEKSGVKLGLWVRISPDGIITLIAPSSEMGQGVNTSLSMILAEELEADWSKIKTETAPANSDFKNPDQPMQLTGGSASIKGFWEPLREVGAAAREMLKTAAAQKWDVPVSECKAQSGQIIHAEKGVLNYGELATVAGKLDVPSDPPLKAEIDFRLIGKPLPSLDFPDKVTGKAQYGIDVRLPGMLFGTVRQSPVFGGEVLSYDEAAAKKITGVKAIVPVPNGIAVVADNTWHAKKGMEALNPQFQGGVTQDLDSTKVSKILRTALDDEGKEEIKAEQVLDLEYEVPYLAHATMEPMNCTANVGKNFCEVWAPTQNQEMSMDVTEDITGLDEDQIQIHTTLLGGGFGRRIEVDYVTQAVTVSKVLQKPVQLIWMREEDMQHDFYRPASMSRFQIGLGTDGLPVQWENQLALPSILKRYIPPMGWIGFDPTSTEGASELPYDIPDFDCDYSMVDIGVPVGFWRSVGSSHNAFYTECALDESVHAANQDPFEYRRKLLEEAPRFRKVLEEVAQKAKWGRKLPEGHGLGIALHKSFGSIVGAVLEISANGSNEIKLHKAWLSIDCGKVINPDTIRAQMQGGFIFGLSAALGEEITLKDGRIEQSNFNDYSVLRMNGAPEISVSIIESGEEIGGVGEPGTPLAAPALANAIFAATGKRYRSLPLSKHGIVLA
ncbi:MAG: xanthine dehydrogenase family protein molybdopterin-binding subunit [SAR324 cluster bacterium]|nr:xanthine dehydrogenase family protein molybdopterin-binding subunit [SAR324 cluster bacterium]MBL7034114.1 xanthine dehydrogenase family protein molybdopterin-binding subunit [SAR324 cluster bacterium]